MSAQVRIVISLPHSQGLNDVDAKVLYEEKGEAKRLVVLAVNDQFDVTAEPAGWSTQITALRQKYLEALNVKHLTIFVI